MSAPRLRDKKKSATLRPTSVASAKILVTNESTGAPLAGASVQIVGAKLRAGAPTVTNKNGVLETGPFLPGQFVVNVSKTGFGPFTPPLVLEGVLSQVVNFLPNDQLTTAENEVTFHLALRNPKLIVTVEEVLLLGGAQPLPGAAVQVVGASGGPSDNFGVFGSTEVPFGKVTVTVSKAGFTPETQNGPGWSQQIELLNTAFVNGTLPDFNLTVRMLGPGVPQNLPSLHPKPLALWLNGGPGLVDEDATLVPPGASDTPQGQAGWDFAESLVQNSFASVAKQLGTGGFAVPARLGGGTVAPNQIARLAIVAHGDPGVMDVNQLGGSNSFGAVHPDPSTSLTVASFAAFIPALDDIGSCLMRGASVYLIACQLAEPPGEALLRLVSQRWPTVRVVGIRTLAAIPTTIGKKGIFDFPGMRDTRHRNTNTTPGTFLDHQVAAICNDLKRLPWFSETSTHATVFLDGNLIRRGADA